jgi:hypothetical protein
VTGDSFLDMLKNWLLPRAENGHSKLFPRPPGSSDFTPSNFFLWGFVKDSVYLPPLPTPIQELREHCSPLQRTSCIEFGMSLITAWMCVVWPKVHTHWRIVINA